MSDSHESCSSSDSLDYGIVSGAPTCEEARLLLQQCPFVADGARLISHLADCHTIRSGDLVLGLCATADYERARECLAERIRSAVDDMLGRAGDAPAAQLFFGTRITNVPLDMVHEMYGATRLTTPRYLVVSQLARQGREAQKRACAAFPEFDPADLRLQPRNEEEVLLLKYPTRTSVDCGGRRYRVSLLTQEELRQFIDDFGAELGHG